MRDAQPDGMRVHVSEPEDEARQDDEHGDPARRARVHLDAGDDHGERDERAVDEACQPLRGSLDRRLRSARAMRLVRARSLHRQAGSASSFLRASSFAACSASLTSGQLRSSDPIDSTRTCATSACITCLLSAGITYHGAHGVEVARDGVLVGRHVVVPPRPLGDVGGVELPSLPGVSSRARKRCFCSALRDVQEELHDLGAVAVEVALERVDVLVALLPERSSRGPGGSCCALEPLGVDPDATTSS